MSTFEWSRTKQFNTLQIILATFIPSGIAFFGFHFLLPIVVQNGISPLMAWPIIASIMLFGFALFALFKLIKEAKSLQISIWSRLCLKKLTLKQWLLSIAILIVSIFLSAIVQKTLPPLLSLIKFKVPDYMPFFLNPFIDPSKSSISELSQGLNLKGNYLLLLLVAITLLLNILTEEFYFRAWMMPKLAKYKWKSWIIMGFLFALYHTFQLWLFPTLLVASLAISLVMYLTKSLWPVMISHLLGNFILSILGVLMLIL